MDVLFLIPFSDNFLAQCVLDLPQNAKHVETREVQLSGRVSKRRGMVIRVPAAMSPDAEGYFFSIGSEEGHDIYMPTAMQEENFRFRFRYVISAEFPEDPPRLVVDLWSMGPVYLVDPLTEVDADKGSAEHVQTRTRYLHNPRSFSVAAYDFLVIRLDCATGLPGRELRKIQRAVAGVVDEAKDEFMWSDGGQQMGSGGFGSVSLTYGTCTGAVRARKYIELDPVVQKIDEMRKEVMLMRMLRHDHILRCFDDRIAVKNAFTAPTRLVLEYSIMLQACHGSLDALLDLSPTVPLADMVARQIGSAIAYLHDNNVVHRDIKPQNVLFKLPDQGEDRFWNAHNALRDEPEQPITFLLGDFGVSRMWDRNCSTFTGTLAYMAPEVIGIPLLSYTRSVDIYSFGVTILQVLDNERFLAESRAINHGLDHHSTTTTYRQRLLDLADHRIGTHSLWQHVKSMLQQDPADRPTAHELCARLDADPEIGIIDGCFKGFDATKNSVHVSRIDDNEGHRQSIEEAFTHLSTVRAPRSNTIQSVQPTAVKAIQTSITGTSVSVSVSR